MLMIVFNFLCNVTLEHGNSKESLPYVRIIPVRRPTNSHRSWSENQVTNKFTNLVTVCVINIV